jgi:IclR family pca regulon transcriptional regulator
MANERGDRPVGREHVQSLERGLAVLRAFGPEQPAMTLSDVARETGLTRAAARRFLLTLEQLGYVGSDGRLFSLRARVLELGYSYLSSLPMWDLAQEYLATLVAELQESSSVSVLDGDEIVYVIRVPTKRIMTINLTVGTRLPAYPTSMGRVLLASLDAPLLDDYFERTKLVPLTERTVVDEAELRGVLAGVREAGWAIVDQELELGVRSVAVPLSDGAGRVVAALNVSGHATRVSIETLRERFLPRVIDTAAHISAAIASRPST